MRERGIGVSSESKLTNSTSSLTEGSPEEVAHIRIELVKFLAAQMPAAITANLLNTALVVFLLKSTFPFSFLCTWVGGMIVALLVRTTLTYGYRAHVQYPEQGRRWHFWFIVGTGLSGVMWGLAAILLFPHASLMQQLFLALVFCGTAAGAVATLSANQAAFFAFVIPIALPTIVRLAEFADSSIVATILALSFLATLFVVSHHHRAILIRSLAFRFQNFSLVHHLTAAKQEAESFSRQMAETNHALQTAITEATANERLKDELVSTVSHELRTPLTSLRGFSELLLKREFPPEKQKQFLAIIHNESVRLTALINDFLDLQRIESGRQTYNFEQGDISWALQESLAVFQREDGLHHFHIEAPDTLPLVRIDVARIHQVLTNLISNAVKYSPQGGVITVKAASEKNKIVVSVTDQGIGIPLETQAKLFSKFFRVDSRETRSIGGTGLGLALVRDIIEAHGGRVWVESTLGQGSTFSFALPLVGSFDVIDSLPSGSVMDLPAEIAAGEALHTWPTTL
jgi:signal transduction histidine kinase